MTHALKTWVQYFDFLKSGQKKFELRKDDRPFKVGDTLLSQEWDTEKAQYTGDELAFTISYILRDCPEFGLKKGYVILGLSETIHSN